MRRYIIGVPVAVVISIALFYLMRYLISGEVTPPEEGPETGPIEIGRTVEDSDTEKDEPEQVRPIIDPPPPVPKTEVPKETPNKEVVVIDPGPTETNVVIGDGPDTGSPVPIVRIEPQYPLKAVQQGISGWVEVEFTVTEQGSVEGATVVRCVENDVEKDPGRCVFTKESEKAVNRWKYRPQIEDGEPVRWTSSVILSFDLTE